MRRGPVSFLLVGWIACTSGCLLDAPPADGVLAGDGALETPQPMSTDDATLPLAERGRRLQIEIDGLATAAMAQARRTENDPDLALEAARRLFQAADLRLRRSAVAAMTEQPPVDIAAVFEVENEPDPSVVEEVLSLCTSGLEFADIAARGRPEDVAAQLHRGLHLAMIAWANGPARSLFAGLGPAVQTAIASAVELDPAHDDAAPLRLQGRFLRQAPWPVGDLELALVTLQRAVEIAPVCINHLFLGDALCAADRGPAAVAEWQAALVAPSSASNRHADPFLRAAVRQRLAVIGAPPGP